MMMDHLPVLMGPNLGLGSRYQIELLMSGITFELVYMATLNNFLRQIDFSCIWVLGGTTF